MAKRNVPNYHKESAEERRKRIALGKRPAQFKSKKTYTRKGRSHEQND